MLATVLSPATYFGETLLGRYEFVPIVAVAIVLLVSSMVIVFRASDPQLRRGTNTGPVPWTRIGGALPGWSLGTAPLFGLVSFINLATFLVGTTGGNPVFNQSTHRYELDSHGSITVISRSAYEHAVARIDRGALGIAMVFLAMTVPLAMNGWLRNRQRTD